MNLESLKWTKNVKPSEGWAYSDFEKSELFKLAWKDNEDNANRPERGDLILLRQHAYVTHLVKVLDRKAEREEWQGEWSLYRIVEVVWSVGHTNPLPSLKSDLIFGYPGVLAYMGGDVMKLEELPTFQDAWDRNGGLAAFQAHVQVALSTN
ncbi:MAG: hypothetical protein RLZZ511_2731 [Cyanobacteriota bacterium]